MASQNPISSNWFCHVYLGYQLSLPNNFSLGSLLMTRMFFKLQSQ